MSTTATTGISVTNNQNTPQPITRQPQSPRMCACGNVVNESEGTCKQCFGQINESTSKPILLD